jgi:hypothetical protein
VRIPSPVDAPKNSVSLLLAQADAYKTYGTTSMVDPGRQLTFPPDDSAVGLYNKVLGLEPDNAQAKAGLEEVAAFYLKKSRASCDRFLWKVCFTLSEEGLKADAQNAELKSLRDKAQAAARGD